MNADFDTLPGMVRLRRGDILKVHGRRQVVVAVNDCCARVAPEKPEVVEVATRFGGSVKFARASGVTTVAAHVGAEAVLGSAGAEWVENYLASKARRKGQVSEDRETDNQERKEEVMPRKKRDSQPKDKTKARGGLAADARELREQKQAPEPAGAEPKSRGKLGEVFGHSVVSVLRTLGKEGATTAHCRAIMAARGVPVKDSTCSIQVSSGRSGKFGGKPVSYAPLTEAQVEELLASAPDPKAAKEAAAA